MDRNISPETCLNFSYFKEHLKALRKIDDNIILKINSAGGKSVEACSDFFQSLAEVYLERETAINYCNKMLSERLEALRKDARQDPKNSSLRTRLYAEEAKLRSIRNEYEIENIIRSRSFRVFSDRCHSFIPPGWDVDFLITEPKSTDSSS